MDDIRSLHMFNVASGFCPEYKIAISVNNFIMTYSSLIIREGYVVINLGRHLVSASDYRDLRQGAFASWKKVTVA